MRRATWHDRWIAGRPAAIAVMVIVMIATFAAVIALNLSMPAAVPSYDVTLGSWLTPALPLIAIAVIATVVMVKAPSNPVGWLLAGLIVSFGASGASSAYLDHVLYMPDLPQWLLAPLVLAAGAAPVPSLFIQLLLVFPDGHLPSRRWRLAGWVNLLLAVCTAVGSVIDPHAIGDGHRFVRNPLALASGSALSADIGVFSVVLGIPLVAVALLSLVFRYLHADDELREQLKWFGFGVAVLLVGFVVALVTASSSAWVNAPPLIASAIGFSALPLCIAIAILRHRLFDIDVVINRTLVYGSLAVFIGAVYVGIAVGIGSLIGSGGKPNLELSILATAVVAVGFQPLRERLQKLANRLVYGKRASPYEVLSEFSSHVAESYASEEVLSRMARVLAEGTGAEHAEVWLRQGDRLEPVASWPEASAGIEPHSLFGQNLPRLPADRAVAVRHQGELLGALTVSKRRGEALTPIEEKLLGDLAHQAGLVLKNVGLTQDLRARLAELRASRQRLVAAQDQERRRLERNLHDGAQQHLVALKVKLGLVEALATKDPDKARATLSQLKADADEALETLRDLARGIYPPLLADMGLVAALEAHARKATLPVSVEADRIGRYSQEIESAIYFCCLEALQNVQKYAQAKRAVVKLAAVDGQLVFDINDDGCGFNPDLAGKGSGLQNMKDRLEALGGRVTIESSAARGTKVTGRVPGHEVRAA